MSQPVGAGGAGLRPGHVMVPLPSAVAVLHWVDGMQISVAVLRGPMSAQLKPAPQVSLLGSVISFATQVLSTALQVASAASVLAAAQSVLATHTFLIVGCDAIAVAHLRSYLAVVAMNVSQAVGYLSAEQG
jgi:hypothetical protein